MRTAYVCALVASLLIFSGCGAINGPGGGGQWGGFCNDGSCNGGSCNGGSCNDGSCNGGQSTGYGGKQSFGLFRSGGSKGCDSNGGSGECEQNFSDSDCGPMCGAYLSDTQTGFDSCDCGSCEVSPSYAKRQFNSWFRKGISWPRPFAGKSANAGCDSGGCDSGGCDSYGGEGNVTPAGPCRGLGAMVGCLGCRECGGGNAVGKNHSDMSGSCTVPGCSGCDLAGHAKGLLSIPFRPGGSPHPYAGEIPHTAAAGGPGGAGGAAPTYAYPYYTTRGPRDFLMMNPPSIGR